MLWRSLQPAHSPRILLHQADEVQYMCMHTHTQTRTLNRQSYQRLTKRFTKACKKPGLKKRRGMNQSASQPKREGRLCCPRHVLQGPHSSYHRTAEKLKSSLLSLAPHRNEAIHSHLDLPWLPKPHHLTIIFLHYWFRGHLLFSMLISRSVQATAKPVQIFGGNGCPLMLLSCCYNFMLFSNWPCLVSKLSWATTLQIVRGRPLSSCSYWDMCIGIAFKEFYAKTFKCKLI